MSRAISELFVSLHLRAESFNNDLRQAARETKEFEKNWKPTLDLAKDIGIGMVAAGGAIVGAMTAAVVATADYGDAMNDASKRTGVTVENLSKLKLAAESNGSSFEGLSTGLKFLAKNMELAIAGGEKQLAAFEAAGVSAKDLRDANGDVTVIMDKVADTFAKTTDNAAKTTLSMELYGKSGADLIPMMNEGSAGLKRWGDEAERTGRVMSKDAAEAADAFNDELLLLKSSAAGLAGAIGEALIPALTDLMRKAQDGVNGLRQMIAAHPELTKAVFVLSAAIAGAGGLLVAMAGIVSIAPAVKVAWVAITGPIGLAVAAFAAVTAGVVYFRTEIATVLMAAFATVIVGFEKLMGAAGAAARALGADGMADKILTAKFALEEFRMGIDSLVVAGMAQSMTIEKTSGQLAAETAMRKTATDTTKDHSIHLKANTDELDKNAKAAKEMADFWTKELQAFRNATFDDGGDGMAAARAIARQLIADQKELAEVRQKGGDAYIADLKYWAGQEAEFRQRTKGDIDQEVRLIEDANGRKVDGIIKVSQEQGKAAKEMSAAWSTAMGNLTAGFATGITDMLFKAGDFSDKIVGIFSSTARSMTEALIAGLFSPVTEELGKLGAKMAGAISGMIGGKSNPYAPGGSMFEGPTLDMLSGGAGGSAAAGGIMGFLGPIGAAFGIGSLIGSLFGGGQPEPPPGYEYRNGVFVESAATLNARYGSGNQGELNNAAANAYYANQTMSGSRVESLLQELVNLVRNGQTVTLNGDVLARGIALPLFDLTGNEGFRLSGYSR